jgi:hypothetical protein
LQQQLKIDLLKQAAVSPIVEIALHRRERRKVQYRADRLSVADAAEGTRSRPARLAAILCLDDCLLQPSCYNQLK